SNNTRFIRTNRHSTRQNRHTMGSEEILRLILVEVHYFSLLTTHATVVY
ncbi:hypothetical protein DES30_1021069, partial [Prauserella marina]